MGADEGLDQFFTPASTAEECWAWLRERLDFGNKYFIEPSAGLGAFLKEMPLPRVAFEKDPELAKHMRESVIEQDFLRLTPVEFGGREEELVAVGNPPFLYRGKGAVAFINKCFELGCDYVAFVLPAAFKPYPNDDPPVIEKQIEGGYSIDWMDVPDHFELPDGGEKDITNCVFVLYKKGTRPQSKKKQTCDSYISVHTIRTYRSASGKCSPTGMQHADKCDIYLPNSLHWGQRHRMKPYDDFCMKAMFGVKVKRREVLEFLRSHDWLAAARQSSNQNLSLGKETIKQEVIKAGFVDEPAPDWSEPPIAHLHYIVLVGKYRQREDCIERCSLFLPACAYGKDPIKATNEMVGTRSIGLEILRHPRADELREWVLNHNWDGAARTAPTTHRHLGKRIVERELRDAGFL